MSTKDIASVTNALDIMVYQGWVDQVDADEIGRTLSKGLKGRLTDSLGEPNPKPDEEDRLGILGR